MPKVTIKNVSCAAPTVQAAKIVKYKQEGSSSAAVVQAAPKKKRVRTGPLLYCDIPGCTYASIHRQNLTRHKAGKHNINVTWYSCDLCPYRAKQRSDLKDHKAAVHFIDVVWLPCTEPGCSYRAKRKRALTEHLADRHLINLKWWPCKIPGCSYRAKRKQALELHEAAMHNINVRWHKCSRPNCEYRSMQTSNLRRHEISHDVQKKKAEDRVKKQSEQIAQKVAKKKKDDAARMVKKEQAVLRKKHKDSIRYFTNKRNKFTSTSPAKREVGADGEDQSLVASSKLEAEVILALGSTHASSSADEDEAVENVSDTDTEDETWNAFPSIPGL
jgi:hypothetical protein